MKKKKKKNVFLLLIPLLLIVFAIFTISKSVITKEKEKNRINEIKKGWYVQINTEFINVRKTADRYDVQIGKVLKGEIYAVLDFDYSQLSYNWYYITLLTGEKGWIANPKNSDKYLVDVNNPNDYATPTIKFYEDEYHTESIHTISYNHLKLWDDKNDYKVNHVVYHERGVNNENIYVDQYWIKYTITDATGKSSSKLQKITFDQNPTEDEVEVFTKQ